MERSWKLYVIHSMTVPDSEAKLCGSFYMRVEIKASTRIMSAASERTKHPGPPTCAVRVQTHSPELMERLASGTPYVLRAQSAIQRLGMHISCGAPRQPATAAIAHRLRKAAPKGLQ